LIKKLHVLAGNGHHQVFFENALGGAVQFLKRRFDEEISSSVFHYFQVVLWYRVEVCEKGGFGGSAVLSLGTIQRSFWGGWEYLQILPTPSLSHMDPPDIITLPVNNGTLMTRSPHQYATETV